MSSEHPPAPWQDDTHLGFSQGIGPPKASGLGRGVAPSNLPLTFVGAVVPGLAPVPDETAVPNHTVQPTTPTVTSCHGGRFPHQTQLKSSETAITMEGAAYQHRRPPGHKQPTGQRLQESPVPNAHCRARLASKHDDPFRNPDRKVPVAGT